MTAVSSDESPWPAYNQAQVGRRPRTLCVDVLSYAGEGGGRLAVDLFGDRDSWAGRAGMTFFPRPAAGALFDGLEVVSFDEEDAIRPAFKGLKRWHVFHVIARA